VDESANRWSASIRRRVARLAARPRLTGRPTSPNGASSFHLIWEVPTGEELVEASVSLVVPVLPSVPRLYFWALMGPVPTLDSSGAPIRHGDCAT